MDALKFATNLSAAAFVTCSVASAGLCVSPREAAAQLRRWRLVAVALLTNFALAPAIAWAITRLIPMKPGHASGLLLLGGVAGAPFLPKLVEAARGDRSLATALMTLLVTVSILLLPLAMPVLAPGWHGSMWEVVRPVLLMVALPLAAGMTLARAAPRLAHRAEAPLRRISDLGLLAFFTLVLITHREQLWATVGSGAILAAVLFTGCVGGLAYLVGGRDPFARRVVGLAAAQRNIAIALITAAGSFPGDLDVGVMVLVTTIVSIAMGFGAAWQFRRMDDARAGVTRRG